MWKDDTESRRSFWSALASINRTIVYIPFTPGISVIATCAKRTVSQDFRLQVFSGIGFPQAPQYPMRAVSNLSKIRRDIRSSRSTTTNEKSFNEKSFKYFVWVVDLTYRYLFFFKFTSRCKHWSSLVLFPLFATDVVDTLWQIYQWGSWYQFATNILDTGGKFATGINNTSGSSWKFTAGVVDGKFATGVNNTGRKLPPVSLIKVVHLIFRGLGEEDSRKPEAKNLVTLSL